MITTKCTLLVYIDTDNIHTVILNVSEVVENVIFKILVNAKRLVIRIVIPLTVNSLDVRNQAIKSVVNAFRSSVPHGLIDY